MSVSLWVQIILFLWRLKSVNAIYVLTDKWYHLHLAKWYVNDWAQQQFSEIYIFFSLFFIRRWNKIPEIWNLRMPPVCGNNTIAVGYIIYNTPKSHQNYYYSNNWSTKVQIKDEKWYLFRDFICFFKLTCGNNHEMSSNTTKTPCVF